MGVTVFDRVVLVPMAVGDFRHEIVHMVMVPIVMLV
jgi:hypothetical protein